VSLLSFSQRSGIASFTLTDTISFFLASVSLSIIGLVYTFSDAFEVTTKRSLIYETLAERDARKYEEKEEKRKAAKTQV